MNLKTIIAKVVSWFKGEAKAVELAATNVEAKVLSDVYTVSTYVKDGKTYIAGIAHPISTIEATMSTPAAAPATTASNVNAAIQIALALKAIDASLSVDAVQAATNAALAALYPAA